MNNSASTQRPMIFARGLAPDCQPRFLIPMRGLLLAATLLALPSVFVFSARAGTINWNGKDANTPAVGNFNYTDNWYGNADPANFGGWIAGNDLHFSYNQNPSGGNGTETNIIDNYGASPGWVTIGSIYWDSTFYSSIGIINFSSANGYGINFGQKLENDWAGNINITCPLSGGHSVANIQLNPVAGNLTISNAVFNDSAVEYQVWGGTANNLGAAHNLILQYDLVGGAAGKTNVDMNIEDDGSHYGIVDIKAAQTWGGSTNIYINAGELWMDTGGSLATGQKVTVGDGTGATPAKLWLSPLTGGYNFTNPITTYQSGTVERTIGGLNTSGTDTFYSPITLNGQINLSAATGGTVNFAGPISGSGQNVVVNGFLLPLTGVVQFSGTNTYSGNTYISGGTLQFNATGNASNSPIFYLGETSGTNTANLALGATTGGQNFTNAINIRAGSTGVKTISSLATSGTNILSGTLTLSNSVAISAASGGNLTFSGIISGPSFGLTNVGSGVTLLTGVNTFSGPTTISAGTLTLGGAGQLGSGNYATNIFDSTALVDNSSAAQTLSGLISGSGSLTNSGAGTLTLSGANTYSGSTTISAGTVQYTGSGANSGGGSYTVSSGGSLTLNTSGQVQGSTLTFAGNTANTAVNLQAGTLALSTSAGTITSGGVNNALNFNGGTLKSANASGINIGGSLPILIVAGGGTLDTTGGNITSSSGFGYGSSTGTSAFIIQGGNTFNGAFTSGSTWTGPVQITGAGTKWVQNGADSLSGALNIGTGATYDLNNAAGQFGGLTGAGTITNSAPIAVRILTVTGTGGNNFSGSIVGGTTPADTAVTVNLTSGTQTISGANSYSGGTTVSGGTLALSGSGTLGSSSSALTLSGGTLDLGTLTTPTVGAVSITSAAGSGNTMQNGSLTGTSYAASLTTGNAVVTANLLGSGVTLSKSGAGTLTLTGANTFSGATTFSAGTLQLQNASALANSALTMSSGTTLSLEANSGTTFSPASVSEGGSGTVTYNYYVANNGSGTGNTLILANVATQFGPAGTTDTFNLTGANNYTLQIGSGSAGTGTLNLENNTTINSSTTGVTLNIPGGLAVNYNSSYTLTLGGAGNISLGALTRNGANNLTPTFGGSGSITLTGADNFGAAAGTISSTGTLALNNNGALTGLATLALNSAVTLDNTSGSSVTIAGTPAQT
jgi:autotransporter-associated beta strand protein